MELLVNKNNLWLCDVDMACHMATRLSSSYNISWLMTLTSHYDSRHWFHELISFISQLKILLSFAINNDYVFHVMMTWHAIWQQNVSNCHGNLWFFVCLVFMAPIFIMACHNFLCVMKFLKSWIHVHVYVY